VTVLKVLINLILVQKFILFIFQSLSLRDKRKTHLKIDEKKRKFSLNHNSTIKKKSILVSNEKSSIEMFLDIHLIRENRLESKENFFLH